MELKPAGDRAVMAILGNSVSELVNGKVMELHEKLRRIQDGTRTGTQTGILESVPAFASLLVCYDPLVTDYQQVCAVIRGLEAEPGQESAPERRSAGTLGPGRTVEIPVCYGGSYGEDLAYVAEHAGLTEEEVIGIHCGRTYRIYMLGFLPGFPYLGGLDERLFTPRLSAPRTQIPAGSVGIGGSQTGIYPLKSPGGWRLIGRTPLTLFSPSERFTPLYRPGDSIRFVPVGEAEYKRIKQEQEG